MRTCTICKETKSDDLFYRRSDRPSGRYSACKVCQDVKSEAWRKSHPKKVSDYRKPRRRGMDLTYRYGITPQEYEALFAEQNGLCAVCLKPSRNSRRLHTDHDHKAGLVRGLLCHQCNAALGMIGDDVDRLMSLAAYLLQSENVLQAYTPEKKT